MNAAAIAKTLRGHRAGRWWRVRCPVHGGHQESLALRDGDCALIVRCHAGCPRRDILEALERQGLLDGTYRPAPPNHDRDAIFAQRMREYARKIWEGAAPGCGSPIETWFRVRRIDLPVPPALRWARSCPHPSKITCPAMIARVDNVEGEFIGIRRTFLLPDGSAKAPVAPVRASLGPVAGGAIRLARAVGEHLLIGEGIESCLSAMWAAELPAWAAGDTGALKNLVLPKSIRTVTILADNDLDQSRGPAAARAAADRLVRQGFRVRIAWPPPGCDFADKWPSSGRAGDAR